MNSTKSYCQVNKNKKIHPTESVSGVGHFMVDVDVLFYIGLMWVSPSKSGEKL